VNCSGLCCRASFRVLDTKANCKSAHTSRRTFNKMPSVCLAGISVFISRPTGNIHLTACACNAPAPVSSDRRGGASSTPPENMSMSGSDDPKSRREGVTLEQGSRAKKSPGTHRRRLRRLFSGRVRNRQEKTWESKQEDDVVSEKSLGNGSRCRFTPSRRRAPGCQTARWRLECRIAVANGPVG